MFRQLFKEIYARRGKLKDVAVTLLESLWFRPICWLIALCLLATALITIDWNAEPEFWKSWFVLWKSQADGAKTMLGSIAGATLTVVSLAFSLMMVVVIQTANAYSPRLLQQFIADRHNHHVLGMLMGSFAYTLIVLRSIREEPGFVPHLAVNVALLLSIFSIIALISFIQNVARSIQVGSIIELIEQQTLDILRHEHEHPPGDVFHGEYKLRYGHTVLAKDSGYIRLMEKSLIDRIMKHSSAVVEFHHHVGDYVLKGSELLTVWNVLDEQERRELGEELQGGVVQGNRRSWSHDIHYGFEQLTDIALKALSPGINDPTTANMAIRSLSKLYRIWFLDPFVNKVANERGELRMLLPEDRMEQMMLGTFWQIVHYGRGDHTVVHCLLSSFNGILEQLPAGPERDLMTETLRDFVKMIDFEPWGEVQSRAIARMIRKIKAIHTTTIVLDEEPSTKGDAGRQVG